MMCEQNASLEKTRLMAGASLAARSAYSELFENNPSNGPKTLPFVGFDTPFLGVPL